jgi:PadR family transcriptional regulator PadR
MHMVRSDLTSTSKLLRGTLDLLLLQALSSGPLHGYAVARCIEASTDDALRVEEGSMYPALHRLETRGFVLAKWSTGEKGRRVRVYALSRRGQDRLAAERRSWSVFARAVSRMVGASR